MKYQRRKEESVRMEISAHCRCLESFGPITKLKSDQSVLMEITESCGVRSRTLNLGKIESQRERKEGVRRKHWHPEATTELKQFVFA